MSFEKLQQINATDLIGGSNNLQLLSYLKHLSETAHQMSLKNSKPFQTKGEVLIPSAALIQLDTAVKTMLQMVQSGYTPTLSLQAHPFVLDKMSSLLFFKVYEIVKQGPWIDLLAINQHPAKAQIHIFLQQLWNEIRGYAASTEAQSNLKTRNKLITDQATENSRVVSRLLTAHTNIQVVRVSCLFSMTGHTQLLDMNRDEKVMTKLKGKLIKELLQLNQGGILCIQWRIQQTLFGKYYLNMLVYYRDQHHLNLPSHEDHFIHESDDSTQPTVQLDLTNTFIHYDRIERDNFQGINLAQWKVIFKVMLYPLKYYYYHSKIISPKFEYIVY